MPDLATRLVVDGRRRPEAAPGRPLRIAVFANEFPALSETFVLNQVTGLIDLGHDVTVFANGPRDEAAVHPDVLNYGLHRRIVYRGMPKSRLARLSYAPGILSRRLDKMAMLGRALDAWRYRREATSLNMLYWTDRLADERPFDVIHCHFGTVGRLAAFFRETGAIRGKLVVTFHGVDVSAVLDREPQLYRHLFRHGDLFLPISERWRQRLIEHGADPSRTVVHRMGIDPRRFTPVERKPAPDRLPRILTIGRMVEKKGIEFGLRAVAVLAARGIPVRYDIVGSGPLRRRLEALARDLCISEQVVFHGWRVQDEVAALLAESDVLLAPSVTDAAGDQEGIPVTLMEAMATAMPVVSTRHSGIPELVEHGRTGYLAGERDAIGLADALQDLLRSPSLAREIGAAARAKIVSDYNIERLNRRLAERFALLSAPERMAG